MSFESKSIVGVLAGAAIGAFVGAVCLAAAVTVAPTSLYTATAVQPAVAATLPMNSRMAAQARPVVGAQFANTQRASYQGQESFVQTSQNTAVYSWAFVLFATVAGAVNGLFLWNNRRVAMAATTGRREALMAGVAAAGMAAGPAFAAYGEGANIFGSAKDTEQSYTISGEGWIASLPGKFNKSKEIEAPGQVGRWEDNFDAVNNALVIVRDGSLGSPEEALNAYVTPLLGKQVFDGPSISEGGFAPGRYASAAVLDQRQETKNGKTYYYYQILTRSADGNEGGRHHIFALTANNGKIYIFKLQAGDKRWFKGLDKQLLASAAGFRVN